MLYERPLKPSLRKHPDHIVLYMGTNDLDSYRPLDLIAKSIVNVVSSTQNHKHDVTVSNIISRADCFKLKQVNENLSKLCVEKNLHLIDHSKDCKLNI